MLACGPNLFLFFLSLFFFSHRSSWNHQIVIVYLGNNRVNIRRVLIVGIVYSAKRQQEEILIHIFQKRTTPCDRIGVDETEAARWVTVQLSLLELIKQSNWRLYLAKVWLVSAKSGQSVFCMCSVLKTKHYSATINTLKHADSEKGMELRWTIASSAQTEKKQRESGGRTSGG